MSKVIVKVIDFGDGETPNKNGRVYTKECVDSAVERFLEKKVMLTKRLPENSATVDLSDVVGVVTDVERDDFKVTCKVEVADEILAEVFESPQLHLVPNGTGQIEPKTKQVTDYNLVSVSLTTDSAFVEDE